MDLTAWLRDLGPDRYEAAFRESPIDAQVLPELTDADPEKLGVLLGHRKKLLKAIATLQPGEAAPAVLGKSPVQAPPEERRATKAERRQLTVLSCDLVGSTELAASLDPEDLREVMRPYQAACAEVVSRFDGHLDRFQGDSVLVYFGWPRAHEDDAERAVRAGLQLVQDIARLECLLEAALAGGRVDRAPIDALSQEQRAFNRLTDRLARTTIPSMGTLKPCGTKR